MSEDEVVRPVGTTDPDPGSRAMVLRPRALLVAVLTDDAGVGRAVRILSGCRTRHVRHTAGPTGATSSCSALRPDRPLDERRTVPW